jgi:enterochelin esterase-like enzyme
VLLEPQSTALFILLMVVFGALLLWVALAREPVFRVLAASLAFVPAMLFGVAAVNRYYDYYQTWGALVSDLSAQGVSSAVQIHGGVSGGQLTRILGRVRASKTATQSGETVRLTVTGPLSHLTRVVYVYLPPPYFQPGWRHYRFPAIELITGYPGEPQDWINVVGITQAFQTLLRDHLARPAVLVMPDANGGRRYSLECLNIPHGPQDATFLAQDLPRILARSFRIQPAGRAWGIAGYSEGGYCTANLALNYPDRYGYAGVMSGYFRPLTVQFGSPLRRIPPFGHNTKLRLRNTPLARVQTLSLAVQVPVFWLGAGSYDHRDVRAAQAFQQALLPRQPNVELDIAPGGAHDMATWRALVPPLLEWMTPRLARAANLHRAASSRPSEVPHPALTPGAGASPAPPPPSPSRSG